MSNTDKLNTYAPDEVFKKTLKYFNGDELATKVWISKYCLKDKNGNLLEESPDDMHWRIAKELYRMECKYPNPRSLDEIYELLKDFKYVIPQGSPMAGIGNNHQIMSISNCFFLEHHGDSYGSIMDIDEKLTHVFKRRGGCIWENQKVYTKNDGLTTIKNVKIGDEILSYNIDTKENEYNLVEDWFYTDVKLDDQIQITFSNGTILKTSKNHPILTLNSDGYVYKKPCELSVGDVCISYKTDLDVSDQVNDEIAWFIGAFIGDGTFDMAGYKKQSGRIRLTKDNKLVVDTFCNVLNKLSDSNVCVSDKISKKYSVPMWQVTSCCKNNIDIYEKYFNYNGVKTFSATTPEYILKNKKYWLSYLAGLIDTDGHVKEGSTVEISLCAKNIIDDLAQMLNILGIRCHVSEKISKRENESVSYKIFINADNRISEILKKYQKNDAKISAFRDTKKSSHGFPIFETEFAKIMHAYTSLDKSIKTNNLYNSLKYCAKHKKIGICLLDNLLDLNIISESEYFNFLNRTTISEIIKDNVEKQYIDIKVKSVNNYFAGEFGFINTHNCGIDLSKLRPNNAFVHNAALSSTGAVSFADRYSNTTREVASEGRRAALMISLSVIHPDVESFVDSKLDNGKITGANISVKITDEFMNAVKVDGDFMQSFPIDAPKLNPSEFNYEYDELISYGDWNGKPLYYKKIKAKKLWDKLIKNAHKSAEPGILFWDTFERESPSNGYAGFELKGVNPCAELSLSDSESCRLLVLNLYSYVVNPFTPEAYFDFELFSKHANTAQRLMDDVVDLEIEKIDAIIQKIKTDPEPEIIKSKEIGLWEEINRKNKNGRRTGLGITATGDLLAAMGLRYGTSEGNDFTLQIHKILAIESYRASIEMAEERGAFPVWNYNNENENPFINRIFKTVDELKYDVGYDLFEKYIKFGRRNIANLTIAPTGSVSIVARTSSGLEPVFLPFYKRRKKTNDKTKSTFIDVVGDMWEEFFVVHPKYNDWFEINKNNLGYSDRTLISLNDIEMTNVFEKSPYYLATANDINWKSKVEMQGNTQLFIDHSISVTTNLPETATIQDVNEIYIKAWESGCKGHTIYRDGSRDGVLISDKKKEEQNLEQILKDNNAPKRPKKLEGNILKFKNNLENWIACIGILGDRPYEIFTGKLDEKLSEAIKNMKKCEIVKEIIDIDGEKIKRYDLHIYDVNNVKSIYEGISNEFNPEYYNYAKLFSGLMRHGMPVQFIIQQAQSLTLDGETLNTWKNGFIRALKKYVKDGEKGSGSCPNCGANELQYKEGCLVCMACGVSKCN